MDYLFYKLCVIQDMGIITASCSSLLTSFLNAKKGATSCDSKGVKGYEEKCKLSFAFPLYPMIYESYRYFISGLVESV
jgi:hypothetical protein